ncbi:MAG TPA: cyclopropane-fatty-acyl-phospholipid synthase family protein [Abditibacteriaceae bacterium]|nr:cyclopropane-fatty-acyl-phospholipid synthase family protein [Abditibacteriaceae bacterium]
MTEKASMRLLSHMLKSFVRKGTLHVIDPTGQRHVFEGAAEAGGAGPVVTMRLRDKDLPRKIFFKPEMGVGEGYMDGTLTFEEGSTLYDFLYLFSINRLSLGSYPLQSAVRQISKRLRALQQYNPVGKAQQNVAHHYDLSRELYELFLDKDLQYSCAYFLSASDTLEQAQENKKRHLASKLLLQPGQKVLDIGCGWGGLALYLAGVADVDVTGVTLSKEQHQVALERARAMSLEQRVHFHLQDYRTLQQRFDRIVSVGMFEHVGVRHYPEFFAKIYNLLEDDGVALIHSIGHMSPPGTAGPWLRKYIFPGAYSPALSEVFAAVEKQSLWVTDVEVWRVHYAETIREWHSRFLKNRARIAQLYDERFCRMWEFYLVAVEMLFRHGSGMVFQMQLARERDAAPLTRDYIYEAESALKAASPAAS